MSDRILIVEDDDTLRVTVGNFLLRQGFDVESVDTGEKALALLGSGSYGLLLLDLRLPDMSGLDILSKVKDSDDPPLVVIMTAYPEVRTAVAALKAGAYDYINKPFDLQELQELLRRAQQTQSMQRELIWRRALSPSREIEGMIGSSPPFVEMVETTGRIAAAGNLPVLLCGESGTGKERVARAIHCQSSRSEGPWVALNCSALPEGLLESEIFGHERGAFTGAGQRKRGLLELASGGTLFLDEIGDMSLALQPKLLRVLETQSFRRLGGEKELRVDVRFVAATHRDLSAMVATGEFRQDLYYRLNVGTIHLPALRARAQDIMPLARHFLDHAEANAGRRPIALDPALEPLLVAYGWPGNVREMRNVMERAAILAGGQAIRAEHLPKEILHLQSVAGETGPVGEAAIRPLAEVEADYMRHVLARCKGNKTQAAELLGITRLTLRNRLRMDGDAAEN